MPVRVALAFTSGLALGPAGVDAQSTAYGWNAPPECPDAAHVRETIEYYAARPLAETGAVLRAADGEVAADPSGGYRLRLRDLDGAFRTPTLRCVAQRPLFFHTGQALGLAPVVAFFDRGGDLPGGYPGVSEIEPLGLTARDRDDLVAFLRTLDGPGPSAELLAEP